ncbi:MAG: UDP-N-acetylglucosamine 1-carboxyvinyltransferase [Cyanobacteria bacterium P01_C01_bin.89]
MVAPVLEVVGGHTLSGHLPVSGAKNSALVLLTASILCSDQCRLSNVPSLVDVARMGQVLEAFGIKVKRPEPNCWELDGSAIAHAHAPYEIVSKLRASFFAIGPLLARLGTARVPLPGGCAIGARPVELHVRGLKSLGADVHIDGGMVNASVPGGRLKGAKIYLDYPSVGATETLMMAATLADGETIIENAAQEPEVVDLANLCRAMGARIKGHGTNTIVIDGMERLHGAEYATIPDRIEAGTFLVAGAITRSDLVVGPVVPDHMTAVIAKLREVGCRIVPEGDNHLRIQAGDRLLPTDIETLPFPGFPTDMQPQLMALLTLAEGSSIITETVFENRLRHVGELSRMGADIRVKGSAAIVSGVPFLSGAPVTATDLRASAALILAGLTARGTTIVQELKHLDRGYENIEQKLRGVGAKIRRITDPNELSADMSSADRLVQTTTEEVKAGDRPPVSIN